MGCISTRDRMKHMSATSPRTLLEPGHEAEWVGLNEEKRRFLTPSPDTPPEDLLRRGQRLSAQAAALLRAIERADGCRGRSMDDQPDRLT